MFKERSTVSGDIVSLDHSQTVIATGAVFNIHQIMDQNSFK